MGWQCRQSIWVRQLDCYGTLQLNRHVPGSQIGCQALARGLRYDHPLSARSKARKPCCAPFWTARLFAFMLKTEDDMLARTPVCAEPPLQTINQAI
jgi:hypothetical protein